MDLDEYNQEKKELREKRMQDSFDVFLEAAALAKENGLELLQHNHWHFSLNLYKGGKRVWRINLYPSNQRIWHDKKCGRAPYLNVGGFDKEGRIDWNLLDVVKCAVKRL